MAELRKKKLNASVISAIRKGLCDEGGHLRPDLAVIFDMYDVIQKVKVDKIWTDGSEKEGRVAYSVYSSKHVTSGVLPEKFGLTNNRGELLAAIIGLIQTSTMPNTDIYTDSSYTKDLFDKIISNSVLPLDNADLIKTLKSWVHRRLSLGHEIKMTHINSHLLDKDAARKVKHYQRKLTSMKGTLGDQFKQILAGNVHADRAANEAVTKEAVPGFFANTTDSQWLLCFGEKSFSNSVDILKDSIRKRNESNHSVKYSSCLKWRIDPQQVNWTATAKLYQSLRFSNSKTQSIGFKIRYNKYKTLEAFSNNCQMQWRVPDNKKRKYEQSGCPFDGVSETIEHVIRCPNTVKPMKKVASKILKVLNSARKGNKKLSKLQFFPDFFWAWPNRQTVHSSANVTNLQAVDTLVALTGLVPKWLTQTLQEFYS